MLAVVDESDTMLATGRALAFEQVWGGRHLRMGGIAGVYIEPSARGQGVASLLMRALIARMVELGDVVSCLFPTAPELYRVVGYEVGGSNNAVRMPLTTSAPSAAEAVGCVPDPRGRATLSSSTHSRVLTRNGTR